MDEGFLSQDIWTSIPLVDGNHCAGQVFIRDFPWWFQQVQLGGILSADRDASPSQPRDVAVSSYLFALSVALVSQTTPGTYLDGFS